MDDKKLLRIIQILVDKIGANEFDIFEKMELNELTNEELFNCDEVNLMLNIRRQLKEMGYEDE